MTPFRHNIVIDGEAYGESMAMAAGLFDSSVPSPSSTIPGGVPIGVPGVHGQRDAYQATVRKYSGVYESSVADVLGKIDARMAGRAVLRSILQQARRVTIVPLPESWKRIATRRTSDSPNAFAVPLDAEDATRKLRLLRSGEDGEVLKPWRRGTGDGSDGEVQFHPWELTPDIRPSEQTSCQSQAPPGDPVDEGLLHELVHILRFMAGARNGRKVPFQRLYDTIEEFYAIVITNIYRSECGCDGLRQHHHEAPPSYITAEAFLKVGLNREHLRKLRRQHPQLFADLHAVDAPFNPIRRMWLAEK